MTQKLFFESVKTGKRYEVVAIAEDKSTITLRGELAQFTEPYDKERFIQLGYKLVKVEVEDDA